MISIERDDKQIKNAAKSVKAYLLGYAKSKKESDDISDKIDEIENELKVLNRMTEGKFGQYVNSLNGFGNRHI